MPQPRPVIMDVDTGVDDSLAIALAVNSPEIELVAVMTLAGNIDVDYATANTRNVVAWLGRDDIPVHRGASRPLARAARDASHYHGANGLGDARLPTSAAQLGADRGPAAIIRHVLARPGEITLVCVGPLTNLAIALNVCPELAGLVDRLVVMGGAFGRRGNVTPHAEFNIWADPEAAEQVFATSFKDAAIVGLDVTELIALDRSVWQTAASRASKAATLIDQVCRRSFFERGESEFFLHDPVALGLAFDPSFAEAEPAAIEVVLSGEQEGLTTVAGTSSWRWATRPDRERFVAMFEERTGLR